MRLPKLKGIKGAGGGCTLDVEAYTDRELERRYGDLQTRVGTIRKRLRILERARERERLASRRGALGGKLGAEHKRLRHTLTAIKQVVVEMSRRNLMALALMVAGSAVAMATWGW